MEATHQKASHEHNVTNNFQCSIKLFNLASYNNDYSQGIFRFYTTQVIYPPGEQYLNGNNHPKHYFDMFDDGRQLFNKVNELATCIFFFKSKE